MQSLGQAVYRYVCKYSSVGIGKRKIIKEMASRGYLQPINRGVSDALCEYIAMGKIVLRRGHYVHKKALELLI